MFKKFVAYYRPHKKLFTADMICALLVAVCTMFYPMITRAMINDYIPNRNLRPLITGAVMLLFIYLIKMGLNYFILYYGHIVGVRIQVDMRNEAFSHMQRLPFSYFDSAKSGTIMSRIIGDTVDIAELAHHGPEDLFLSLITLLGSFFLLLTVNWQLALIIFAFIPPLMFFAAIMRRKLSRASMAARVEIGEVNAKLESSISGVRVSKAFTSGKHEVKKFSKGTDLYAKAAAGHYKAMAEFYSGTSLIMDLLILVTIVAGGLYTYYGRISAGDFAAYLLFSGLFTEPIKKLINFVEQLQSGITGFERIQQLMAVEPEKDDPGAEKLENVVGDIAFEDVHFVYNSGKMVLDSLSLEIPRGKTVAIVGPSGGGKSTLCHLLPRFYEIDGGKITIDGRDIHGMTRLSLRRNIGIVQQDTFLFSGTIRDNIAYGDFGASDEEITRAATLANIHDYICTLPEGYNTYVGERGVMLSGGQKQRISIARVFLKNPPILILDEATSALDNASELVIQKSLEDLSRGRTTLVVAHRLSTVQNADKIVVLTEAGIVESGTHTELLALGGVYAGLHNRQLDEPER